MTQVKILSKTQMIWGIINLLYDLEVVFVWSDRLRPGSAHNRTLVTVTRLVTELKLNQLITIKEYPCPDKYFNHTLNS